MRSRISKMLATSAALMCLAATTAWAGLQVECFCAHLNGVDRCGNLICCERAVENLTPSQTECNATFVALVNTCTGKATGTACGCVRNESCRLQIYCNNNCFGSIEGICNICSSLYTVCANGKATLVATGEVCCQKGD
jgi:hypothetical protein